MSQDPKLWASLPFGNRTALVDFYGTFHLWHRALARQITQVTGQVYRTYPLGDGGGKDWLRAVQKQYQGAAQALGIAPPPDLQSYDLGDPQDFASWTFQISQESERLRKAAGLT